MIDILQFTLLFLVAFAYFLLFQAWKLDRARWRERHGLLVFQIQELQKKLDALMVANRRAPTTSDQLDAFIRSQAASPSMFSLQPPSPQLQALQSLWNHPPDVTPYKVTLAALSAPPPSPDPVLSEAPPEPVKDEDGKNIWD